MKKIKKKRIVLYCPWAREVIIGAEEFDSALSDDNILGAFHEVGKTVWLWENDPFYQTELWYLKEQNGIRLPYYKVEVREFYIDVPTFWDKVKDALR